MSVQDNNVDGLVGEFGLHSAIYRLCARQFFDAADKDGDGSISKAEVARFLVDYDLAEPANLDELFAKYDGDGDGKIDSGEFTELLMGEGVVSTEQPEAADKGSSCAIL